jgi:uncharacterized repeat protein (TIGR01451 family)
MKNKIFTLLLCSVFLFFNACTEEDEVPSTDLSVTQTVSSDTPVVGKDITFTITVQNSGPSEATGVTVTDNIPAGYTLVSATPTTGTWAGATWTIGKLASGASATLTIIAKVNATGPYAHAVTIAGTETDPMTGNNTASKTPVPVVKINYVFNVKPLLVASCAPCHLAGGANPNKWDDYTQTKAKITIILDRVQRAPGSAGFMPKVGTQLTAAQIATLKQWVTDGLLEN